MVVHAGKDGFKERAFPLCIGPGYRQHLASSDAKTGDRTVAGRKFDLDRIEFFWAGKRDVHAGFWPGHAEEAAVVRQGTGKPRAVADKCNKPHPVEQFPQQFLVKGGEPRGPERSERGLFDNGTDGTGKCCELVDDLLSPIPPAFIQLLKRQGAADNQVKAVIVGEVPRIRFPEVRSIASSEWTMV
jgi:hypothetical protein